MLVCLLLLALCFYKVILLLLSGRGVLIDFIEQLLYWDVSEGGGRQVDRWTNKQKEREKVHYPSALSMSPFVLHQSLSLFIQVCGSIFLHFLMHSQQ